MIQLTPAELLDRALTHAPGVGEPFEFPSRAERESFRARLFAAMSRDARLSRTLDPPDDPEWGKHRWGAVRIERLGNNVLWVGRVYEPVAGKPITLAKARSAV